VLEGRNEDRLGFVAKGTDILLTSLFTNIGHIKEILRSFAPQVTLIPQDEVNGGYYRNATVVADVRSGHCLLIA
jgi:hypothetical protein